MVNSSTLPFGQFRFDVLGELGTGGLGRVDKIEITESNSPRKLIGSVWARKRLNANWDSNADMVARFEREILALKTMSHPNIVTFEGENLPGNSRFYLMPMFGSTVRKLIAAGTWRNNWRDIAKCGAVLADALQYAHDLGFFHRDIKPDNILFNPNGPLVIADWGLGYFVHKNSKVLMQLTRGRMGTEYYCSLEQWATGKCDGRGDAYSLGMTLDEWVRGEQHDLTVGMGVEWQTVNETGTGAARFNEILRHMTRPLAKDRPDRMATIATSLRAAANQ